MLAMLIKSFQWRVPLDEKNGFAQIRSLQIRRKYENTEE